MPTTFGFGVLRRSFWIAAALLVLVASARAEPVEPVIWRVSALDSVGGHQVQLAGTPVVIDRAVTFDGVRDGLFVETNPLEGVAAFTVEILFAPAEGGAAAQRFFHIEDETGARLLFETRLDGKGGWWLDTFLKGARGGLALIDPSRVHPTGAWYWVALRLDGKRMTSFVNGTQEGEGEIEFGPMARGQLSIGVRLNRVYWFKGAIREARFTRESLASHQLQRVAPSAKTRTP